MAEIGKRTAKILVFSTEKISDPAIDMAGLLKMHYPPTVYTIAVPCSSGIKPRWILHAFEKGFDGVFIAADGSDCPYGESCTEKTGHLVSIKDVRADDQLMIITRNGITIRMDLSEMRVVGRATQGVRLIELRNNDQIAAVAKVDSDLNEVEPPAAPDEPAPDQPDDATGPDGTDVANGDEPA